MRIVWVMMIGLAVVGCRSGEASPREDGAAFLRKPRIDAGQARPAVGPVDEPGRVDPLPRASADQPDESAINPVIADAVKPAPPLPATPPSTVPATLPVGQYAIVNAWVADVDGTPIFASQVLNLVERPLALRAKELDERQFRAYAQDELRKAVRTLIRDELLYKAAQRSLTEADRRYVSLLSTKWRQEEINQVGGGSVELTRQRYQQQGEEFEKAVEFSHRRFMTQVYYQRRIVPQIVISASNLRDYYERYQQSQFSEKSGVQFRLIRIDSKEVGSRDLARQRAEEVQKLAAAAPGDFAKLAVDYNKDAYYRKTAGLPMGEQLIERNSFGVRAVEEAAWKLEVGQVSDVLAVDDSFYIIKLEKKQVGQTRPFEAEGVQEEIRKKLYSEQFAALSEKMNQKLEANAIIRTDAKAMNIALDMAMQRYAGWRGK